MALIDALVDKIGDPELRAAIRDQIASILEKRSFGLVYQQHKPEIVELHNHAVRRRNVVRVWGSDETLYAVQKVSNGIATIKALTEAAEICDKPVEHLVVVREFGDPVFPGLTRVDQLITDPTKPHHVVLNSENYHALEALLYTHEGLIDAIYIDPPYNSGARDWKYNNDYVDDIDQYRHSKWLAFIERRLRLAKRLLNPDSSVMIVTIDENEVHHLGMLIEKLFPDASHQMVSIVINSSGQARRNELSRVEEYAFFVFIGDAIPTPSFDDLLNERPSGNPDVIRWESLLRSGTNSRRVDRPNLFYPIFIDPAEKKIVEVGTSGGADQPRDSWTVPAGTVAVWPLKSNGTEGRWKLQASSLQRLASEGFVRLGDYREATGRGTVWYLGQAARRGIDSGETIVVGYDQTGAVQVEPAELGRAGRRVISPATVWNRAAHNAGWHGSSLLGAFLPGRSFPFPKSLYAVEDALRIAVGSKRHAVVLDFFAGSGTTAHAIMRLNEKDDGERQCILVTNNEVAASEAAHFRSLGLRPTSQEWSSRGIFYQVTLPRIRAAITGQTPDGSEVIGEYQDGTPFSSGALQNASFFELTYEDPDQVSLGRRFQSIAHLLWLKAGAQGKCIDEVVQPYAIDDTASYAVLFDANHWKEFVNDLRCKQHIRSVFVVTDSEATFQLVVENIPTGITATQLYEDYMRTFELNTRGGY